MRQLCQRFAASLRRAGLQPGDTLIIVMPNTAEWPIVLLGAMEAGIPVSTANPNYTGGKYTDNARSTLGGFGYVLLGERTPRKVGNKSAVWPLETEKPQIATPNVLLGAFTVLHYVTVIVYR